MTYRTAQILLGTDGALVPQWYDGGSDTYRPLSSTYPLPIAVSSGSATKPISVTTYEANKSGTGYLATNRILQTNFYDESTTPATITSVWYNATTLTALVGAPPAADLDWLEQDLLASVGLPGDASASTDTGTFSLIALIKRLCTKLPGLGQANAAGSVSVVLSSDGPFSTNFGLMADARATWYDVVANHIQFLKLLIASTVGAGSHVYGYNGSNQLTTDAWTLFGTLRTKTYAYTGANMTSETDWV